MTKESKHKARHKEDYLEQLKRVQADFENYRKRIEKERAGHRDRANAELAGKLLECLDNLERALESAEKHQDVDRIIEGVKLTYTHLRSVLAKEGLEEIHAKGEHFDPHKHDAMLTVPGKTDGFVAEELQKGYMFKDKVLRHSKVSVTKME